MPRLITSIVLVGLLAHPVVAQQPDRQKVRELLQLPSITVLFGAGFKTGEGLVVAEQPADHVADAARLEKELAANPGDPKRWSRLGDAYAGLQRPEEAKKAWKKATRCYEELLKANNRDVLSWIAYCELLWADDPKKADEIMDKLPQTFPDSWLAWQGKGKWELSNAVKELFDGQSFSFMALPAPDKVKYSAKAKEHMRLALAHMDKAVELAPREPETYTHRAGARFWAHLMAHYDTSGPKQVGPIPDSLVPLGTVTDFITAADLRPGEAKLVIALVVYLTYEELFLQHQKWKSLSEQKQKQALVYLERLTSISRNKADLKQAALAHEFLGLFHAFLKEDMEKGMEHLQETLRLDPTRSLPWEMATFVLSETNQNELALRTARDRLKIDPSNRARYFLVKALLFAKQNEKIPGELRLMLERDPGDYHANLGLAVIALQGSGKDRDKLAEAKKHLDLLTSRKLQADYKREVDIVHAAYLVLTDRAEEAQRVLEAVVDPRRPDDPARQMLQAVTGAKTLPRPLGN